MIGSQSDLLIRTWLMLGIGLQQCRSQGVDVAAIGPGVKVAGGAGSDPITTDLHVPEQCFAKCDGGLTIFNKLREVRRCRNGDSFKSAQKGRSFSFGDDFGFGDGSLLHGRSVLRRSVLSDEQESQQ